MNYIEFLHNKDKYLGENHDVFLQHYGILGQKWGTRRWQNADGTFNEEGKQRYFGKAEKLGSAKSEAKDYLKFRNKMLKERTTPELNQWYREQHKKDDKQFVKNAKRVDKSREKMYKDQLKDFYDDPNELVNDLKNVYRISGNKKTAGDMRIAGLFGKKTPEEKAEKEGKKLNDELNKANWNERSEIKQRIMNDPKYKKLFDEIDKIDEEKSAKSLERVEEIFNDFEDNELLNLATAGITNMYANGYYPNPTMEDLANCAWFYAYEDGNQGGNTAEYLYSTIDKGVTYKELDQLYKDLHVKKEMRDEGIKLLKENPALKNIDDRHLDSILDTKLQNKYQDNKAYWDLYAAKEDDREPSAEVKKAYSDAKKIAKKLEPSCGNTDGWDYLNMALDNLGLSSAEVSSLTSSDWDKINAEINRLK